MAAPSGFEDRELGYRRLSELGIALSAERNHKPEERPPLPVVEHLLADKPGHIIQARSRAAEPPKTPGGSC